MRLIAPLEAIGDFDQFGTFQAKGDSHGDKGFDRRHICSVRNHHEYAIPQVQHINEVLFRSNVPLAMAFRSFSNPHDKTSPLYILVSR